MTLVRTADPTRSPFEAQHQTIESAADAEEGDAVAGPEEVAVLGQGGGDGERDGADVAEVGIGAELLLLGDPERLEDRLAMSRADLVADDLVDPVAGPAERLE